MPEPHDVPDLSAYTYHEGVSSVPADLPRHNGDGSWRLSIPARIVIRRDGIVAAAEADPDYTGDRSLRRH